MAQENYSVDLQKSPTRDAAPALLMPQAPGIEKSVLSMMTIDPMGIISQAISEGMNEDYFYIPSHRILWELFRSRYDRGVPIDPTSVIQELTDSKRLEAIGGHAGLTDVFSFATSTALFASHFETLKEKYIRRAIIQTSNNSASAAYTSEAEIDQLLDETEQHVLKIRQSAAKADEWSMANDIREAMSNVERMLNQKEELLGLSSGFPKLDKKINGLKSGELFVIAARPAMGKTSFLLNIVEHVALDLKKPVLMFSCEMPSVQLVERLLFSRSHVSRTQLNLKRDLNKNEMKAFNSAMKELHSSKLVIDDTPGISISALRAKARRIMQKNPDLALIGIDYLQLMRSHTKQAQGSREREIAEISGGLKGLAKELGLPIVVLAQLNRGPENRVGKSKGTPQMSDLRESGAIEQDADMIGLLYRPGYYASTEEERKEFGNDSTLLLAKNRNGSIGSIYLSFHGEFTKFVPREPTDKEQEED